MRFSAASGIAIAPILFVIALLAILATAIAAGSGSFSGNTDQEKARMLAQSILDGAHNIKIAVQRVMALGCSDTQLNFYDPTFNSTAINSSAPSDGHCDIFSPLGGGVTFAKFDSPEIYIDTVLSHDMKATGANAIPLVGTSSPELLWIVGPIHKEICDQINILLGLPTTYTTTTLNGGTFVGTYTTTVTVNAAYSGREQSCYFRNDSTYRFYSVLLAR